MSSASNDGQGGIKKKTIGKYEILLLLICGKTKFVLKKSLPKILDYYGLYVWIGDYRLVVSAHSTDWNLLVHGKKE